MVKRIKHIDIKARLQGLDKTAEIGFFDNKTYSDGTSVALVATVQDQGSVLNGIPPRPFMSPAFTYNRERFRNLINVRLVDIVNGKSTASDLFQEVGLLGVAVIKEEIRLVNSPPLNYWTIAARDRRHYSGAASEKPLIDTDQMLDSVDYRIVDET